MPQHILSENKNTTNVIESRTGSWLPEQPDKSITIRYLECIYDGARLTESKTITPESDNWEISTGYQPESGNYTFTFKAKRTLSSSGVAVAFDSYNWSSDNYVMIPASIYNGNRQRIVHREYARGLDPSDYYKKNLPLTSAPIPQLSTEFGAPSKIEVNISNTATPAITYLERQKNQGTILLTNQGIMQGNEVIDHALIVQESPDRSVASFVISAPGVRELKPEFIGFSPSPDRGITVQKGEEIVIRVQRHVFPAKDVPALLDKFHTVRKSLTGSNTPRNLIPKSKILSIMAGNIDKRYLKNDQWEYYCPENADWISFGWIGGLINTYPMLALGDEEHLQKVINTFNFAIPRGQGKSGYFHSTLGSDGKVFGRDGYAKTPEIVLTRQNADVLYWMVKQLMLLKTRKQESVIAPEWESNIKRLADAFVGTWKKHHTWGNFINVTTGEVVVYNTTSGAMAVAGLALASEYFSNPDYLSVAKEAAADYYANFALTGFTSGGCGDILQNSDSETAVALLTSLYTLYEYTNDIEWLNKSIDLANLCATWTVSFDYRLPSNSALAKLNACLTGAVWASTQNKHGAPGFCTQSGDALFKIYRTTGNPLYAELMHDILHAHAEGIQPNGQITERLTYCDADSRGSRGDGGKTGWNETNGALMALEIPGIYLRTDEARMYVFDHIKASVTKNTPKEIVLSVTNPTQYDAEVSLLCEDKKQAALPLGSNAFLNWKKIKVKAGKTVSYSIKK